MALIWADRVKDTTTTTGTGAVTVSGTAPTGYRTLSAVCATNDTLYYCIEDPVTGDWETGLGTYSASNQLTRTTVKASSNSNSAVSFAAGTKNVFLTPIAFNFPFTSYTVDTVSASGATVNITGLNCEDIELFFAQVSNGTATSQVQIAFSTNGSTYSSAAALSANSISTSAKTFSAKITGLKSGRVTAIGTGSTNDTSSGPLAASYSPQGVHYNIGSQVVAIQVSFVAGYSFNAGTIYVLRR